MDFSLVVELFTISIPLAGFLRVHGSLLNQSTCVLWTWRRHSPRPSGSPVGDYLGVWYIRQIWTEFLVTARVLRGSGLVTSESGCCS